MRPLWNVLLWFKCFRGPATKQEAHVGRGARAAGPEGRSRGLRTVEGEHRHWPGPGRAGASAAATGSAQPVPPKAGGGGGSGKRGSAPAAPREGQGREARPGHAHRHAHFGNSRETGARPPRIPARSEHRFAAPGHHAQSAACSSRIPGSSGPGR